MINLNNYNIQNKDELDRISKNLYDNLTSLNIQFTLKRYEDNFIIFFAKLKRDSFMGEKEYPYQVAFIPNEKLESLRFLAHILQGTYNKAIIKKLKKEIKLLNENSLMGHLQLDIDKNAQEFYIVYKYGISLRRNGNELSNAELDHILFYINFLVGRIIEAVLKIEKNYNGL